MAMALAVLLGVPALLVVIGIVLVALGVRELRATPMRRAGVLPIVAGAGTLLCAVLALSVLWSDMPYGVVLLPVLALVLAALGDLVLLALWAVLRLR
ncbi:hypothetical protein [Brachybacterium hainanense]|uniref:Uncharacterized protein n=1 Tax=Brachybacterium hainanense TaxID=1541174 RepID=A0ABV6RD14_9MICO